jgi:hypothetical protein
VHSLKVLITVSCLEVYKLIIRALIQYLTGKLHLVIKFICVILIAHLFQSPVNCV